jgi:putative hemolysin
MRNHAAALALLASSAALAQSQPPPHIKVDSKEQMDQIIMEQARAGCAKKGGKVPLAEHVKGTLLIKCVAPDDPQYLKSQQAAQPAQ